MRVGRGRGLEVLRLFQQERLGGFDHVNWIVFKADLSIHVFLYPFINLIKPIYQPLSQKTIHFFLTHI